MTYIVKRRGDTFSVYEISESGENAILHNLAEWQAHSIAAILNVKNVRNLPNK